MPGMNVFLGLTNDPLQIGDWAKGPQGTGECSFPFPAMYYTLDVVAPCLATGWELGTDGKTLIWHIRKGVVFQNKPPTNGRAMTADDVCYSLLRNWQTRTSYLYAHSPYEQYVDSITAPDKWTVVIRMKELNTLSRAFMLTSDLSYTYPHEVIEKYGDMNDWRNVCGTGPYIFTDFVGGSSALFTRNPDYWMKDPVHPENQLPYLDQVKYLVISDVSTRIAAMRTGKIDVLRGLKWDDANQLRKTNPELGYNNYPTGTSNVIFLRTDVKPFDDIRVRQALEMAADKVMIKDQYYGGNADLMAWPLAPIPDYKGLYPELDKLPPSVRELYEYKPDKAKQLLKEAGYPSGFSMEIVCLSTDVDVLSIVKDNWAKIGVKLDLAVKESSVHRSIGINHTYKDAYIYPTNHPYAALRFPSLDPTNQMNYSRINDAKVNEVIKRTNEIWPDERGALVLYSELCPYILEQSWVVNIPEPWLFAFWQPWIKAYQGEYSVGSCHLYNFVNFIWMDADMKREMTGRK
jgi:peptide/nickel transport system substrate-binding protein